MGAGAASAQRDALAHFVGTAAIPLALGQVDHRLLSVTSAVTELGQVVFAESDSAGISVHRSPALARDDTPRQLSFTLVTGGVHRVSQNDRRTEVTPGRLVVYGSSSPYDLHFDEGATTSTLQVPTSVLGVPDSLFAAHLGSELPPGNALASVLVAMMSALAAHATTATVPERDALGRSLIEVIRALLLTSPGDPVDGGHPLSVALGSRMLAYMRLHLTDPRLSAAGVAKAHGISERYVYLVLEHLGVSFGTWVREHRLALAADALADPARATTSVAAIAASCGLPDAGYFSRVFRRRYGTTPSAWRRISAG